MFFYHFSNIPIEKWEWGKAGIKSKQIIERWVVAVWGASIKGKIENLLLM